jgi:voltage-gated potassium channel Kch
LATYPYSLNVVAKAISIRDFFITLFFVALGMQIPIPTSAVLLTAGCIAALALLVRGAGIFAVLYAAKAGHRTSIVTTLNLSQISEFSLVIVTLGIEFGHVETDTLTIVIWVFSLLAVSSTYAATYSHGLQKVISRILTALRLKDIGGQREQEGTQGGGRIAILGFFRIANAFIYEIKTRHPHLLSDLNVVDFNPEVKQRLDELGVPCHYGDISHYDTLQHSGIDTARVILCTIPDTFLKGTSNAKLLKMLRSLNPEADIVVTAETVPQAMELYESGASYVLQSSVAGAEKLASVIEQFENDQLTQLRTSELEGLSARQEFAI